MSLDIVSQIKKSVLSGVAFPQIAVIQDLSLNDDNSGCYVKAYIPQDDNTVVAKMSWSTIGNTELPSKDDLVIIMCIDNNIDDYYVISTINNKVDKIPTQAEDGSKVLKSLDGKRLWMVSDDKILLSRGDTEPTENIVLGQELSSLLSDILDNMNDLSLKISTHTHIGNMGAPTAPPNNTADFASLAVDFTVLKNLNVTTEKILSDVAFTEK